MLGRVWGMGRSLAMYHAIPGRHRRMTGFYAQFLGPGDLAFDIGAHVGSRVRAWGRLGVRVIAVEPQPDCLKVLRLFFGRRPGVTIVPEAVGAQVGLARLAVSSRTPTVSSMAPGWMHTVTADRRFSRIRWDSAVEVPVTTLDELIARYGEPVFCKIDVEGYEIQVLAGLNRPLRGLSFEYLPAAHDDALAVLAAVQRLGVYRYNYSPIETMTLASDSWLAADGLVHLLDRFRPHGRSGDVYARLVTPAAGGDRG